MHVLIVSATPMEIGPIVSQLGRPEARSPRVTAYRRSGHDVDVLLTGVGMVATASWCSRTLAQTPYDLALNFGVCGSFDRALEPGRVVHVVADRIPELGAEDGDAFLTIEQLNLIGEDALAGGQLVNAAPPDNAALGRLPAVDGITVNTVHGNPRSIAAVVRRVRPQVESMEGAAFMHACLIQGLAFAQVRAVSNFVEKRNRDAWRMAEAIDGLAIAALNIIDGL